MILAAGGSSIKDKIVEDAGMAGEKREDAGWPTARQTE